MSIPPQVYEKAHILLVDDDDVDAAGIQRALNTHGIVNPVIRAHDGLDALAILRDGSLQQPYLILLDINMPRMNGIEFLQELRSDAQLNGSVVFILSTSARASDKHAAYQQQAAGYIVKQRAGEGFHLLARFLEHYWRVVELPNQQHCIS